MPRGKKANWASGHFDDQETVTRPSGAPAPARQPVAASAAEAGAELVPADGSHEDNLDFVADDQPTLARPDKHKAALLLMHAGAQASPDAGPVAGSSDSSPKRSARPTTNKPISDQPRVTFEPIETGEFGDTQTTAARPNLLPKVEFHYHDDEPAQAGEGGASGEDELWAHSMSSADIAAPSDSVRLTQLTALLEALHSGMARAPEELDRLEQDVGSAAVMLARLAGLAQGSQEHAQLSAEIGSQLGRMEAAFIKLERRIALPWLRGHLDALSEPALIYYVRLELQQLVSTPDCWARIDLATTRLARERSPGGDGSSALRPIDQIAPLWAACLPACEAELRVRNKANTYFISCAGRLRGLRGVAELFRSGLYADIVSYKLALGIDFFDPRILYASAKLNITIDTWLAGHPAPPAHELEEWIRAAHETVRTTLRDYRQDDGAFERVRERMRARSAQGAQSAPAPVTRQATVPPLPRPLTHPKTSSWGWLRKLIAAAGIAVLLAVGLPVALQLYGEHKRDLRPLSMVEAKRLHPILAGGSYGGDPPAALIANLDSAQWEPLTPEQRREAIGALQKQLEQRGIHQALLYHDDVLAVNVAGGHVIFLE